MTNAEREFEIGVWKQTITDTERHLISLIRHPRAQGNNESIEDYVKAIHAGQLRALESVAYAEKKLLQVQQNEVLREGSAGMVWSKTSYGQDPSVPSL